MMNKVSANCSLIDNSKIITVVIIPKRIIAVTKANISSSQNKFVSNNLNYNRDIDI